MNTTGYSDDGMYYAYRNYVALTANIYKSTTRYIVTYARIRDHACTCALEGTRGYVARLPATSGPSAEERGSGKAHISGRKY